MTAPHTAAVDLDDHVDVGADTLDDRRVMTIAEACDFLAISRPTLYRFVVAGRLTMYRVGNSRNGARLRVREVEALLVPVDVSNGSAAHPDRRPPASRRAPAVKAPTAPKSARSTTYTGGKWPRTACPKCGTSAAYSPKNGRMQLHYVDGHDVCEVGHRVDQTAVFIPCD